MPDSRGATTSFRTSSKRIPRFLFCPRPSLFGKNARPDLKSITASAIRDVTAAEGSGVDIVMNVYVCASTLRMVGRTSAVLRMGPGAGG